MEIVEKISGQAHRVVVNRVTEKEVRLLKKTKYWFSWRAIAQTYPLFKLTLEDQDEILGVMALAEYPQDNRIEIKLLASSKENVGINKKFEGIVTCLLAYACGKALANYEDLACVSLVPKTLLKAHYMQKYNMLEAGPQLFLEGKPLFDLAKRNL